MTSTAFIVRYQVKDPAQNERVKIVRGEREALKSLDNFERAEKEPKKYRYLWQWKDPAAALAADLEKLSKGNS
jgi:hypothetical protein